MRKNIITGVSLVALSAGMAQAGGFELQTLDTSMIFRRQNKLIFIDDINLLMIAEMERVSSTV